MKISCLIYSIIISSAFFSCKENGKQAEPEITTVETVSEKKEYLVETSDAKFKDENTAVVFQRYIELKTALVNADAEKASKSSKEILKLIDISTINETTKNALQTLIDSKEIETQRIAFVEVTHYVEMQMTGALESGTIYKQYCPMAFNNTGGYWLSESKQIMNPYFGDRMLKCGRVDKEIK